MKDQEEIICCVQVNNVELEVKKTTIWDDDEGGHYKFDFSVRAQPSVAWIDIEALPDLVRALGRMPKIVRENGDPEAAAAIDLDKLAGVLDGLPRWLRITKPPRKLT